MSIRNVECEFVQYRTDDMLHATTRLIHNFARYSGIVGTRSWLIIIGELASFIRNQQPYNCEWRTDVLDVKFSGFLEPIPTIRDGRVVFSSREPRFVFEDKYNDELRPSVKTHVQAVTQAIAREMHDVYRLQIASQNPIILVFPKTEYAKDISIFPAIMFN